MKNQNDIDATKRVKNIAAVLYMVVLTFVVGGSYLHQQSASTATVDSQISQE